MTTSTLPPVPSPTAVSPPIVPRRRRRPRTTFSCEPCKASKLRCNRQSPCATCERKGLACDYVGRSGKPAATPPPTSPVLAPSQPLAPQQSPICDDVVAVGQPRHSQPSAGNVSDDGDAPTPSRRWENMLRRPSPRDTNTASIPDLSFPLTLGPSIPRMELLELLPARDCCDYLVSRYFVYVSPLYNVLDGPAFQKKYQAFWSAPADASLSWLGQLFVVCSLGINTTEPDDPVVALSYPLTDGGETRTVTLSRHLRAACLTCLSLDHFLIRHDLTTLEALLLLIYAISHNEGVERGWVLLGSALNIGIATRCSSTDALNLDDDDDIQRHKRCWAGILMLYTYQSILFRDISLSFLPSSDANLPTVATGSGQGEGGTVMGFKIRLFRLSTRICGKLAEPGHLDEPSLLALDNMISQEQILWDASFLVNGAPSILDTASYAHWCVLQTCAHQLYLLTHRPFSRHRSAVFRPSSRESCLRSSAALLDFHRQFCELPRLRSYRWLIQGMASFNALQGAMAMASCLLDDTSDPQSRDYEAMLVAAVVRIENLQVSSPVCARAFPILRQLQKHVSECLNQGTGTGTAGNQTMDTWFDTDWLNSETFDWMTWDTILPNPTG